MRYIIVLGYQLDVKGAPQPILLDRMSIALKEYHQCLESGEKVQMIFSGGNAEVGSEKKWTEAKRMKHIALNPSEYGIVLQAVEKDHIKKEKLSSTTIQNILNLIENGCLDNPDNQVIIITSAFHQPRVAKFIELVMHYFAEFTGKKDKFNIIVKSDEMIHVKSHEEIKFREQCEKILVSTFIKDDQARFANELINVFKKRGFQLSRIKQIDFASFYNADTKSLNLSCLNIDPEIVDVRFIKSLVNFLKNNKVKHLDLSGNNFGDNIICALIYRLSTDKIRLDGLNLDHNQLTDKSFSVIARLIQSECCPYNLNLGNNNFGLNAESIGKFKVNSCLTNLSLFKNEKITSDWLVALLKQFRETNIKKLNLQHCLKTKVDKDRQKVAIKLNKFVKKNYKLRQLNVADCGFDDRMIANMQETLPQLKSFHVYGNKLTMKGIGSILKVIKKTGSKLTSITWFGYPIPFDLSAQQKINKLNYTEIPTALEENRKKAQKPAFHLSEKQPVITLVQPQPVFQPVADNV